MEYIAIETRVLRSTATASGHIKATAPGVTPVYAKIDPKGGEKIANTIKALHQFTADKIAAMALHCDPSDVITKNVFASSEAGYAVWIAFNRRG